MKKNKNIMLFAGGMAVGFICGGVSVIKGFLKLGNIRNSLKDAFANKIISTMYGEDVRFSRRTAYDTVYKLQYNFTSTDIVFRDSERAEDVLTELGKIIETYGFASVADFKWLAHIASDYIDDNYGWDTLDESDIMESKNGYCIRLPKCGARS